MAFFNGQGFFNPEGRRRELFDESCNSTLKLSQLRPINRQGAKSYPTAPESLPPGQRQGIGVTHSSKASMSISSVFANTPAPPHQKAAPSAAAEATRGGSTGQPKATSNAPPQTGKVAPSTDDLKRLVRDMQHKVDAISSDLQFSVDKETGKDIVKVTDRSSRQVVWQFPSEEALNVTKALDRYQKGLLLNRQA